MDCSLKNLIKARIFLINCPHTLSSIYSRQTKTQTKLSETICLNKIQCMYRNVFLVVICNQTNIPMT